jgi:hypothetical protein
MRHGARARAYGRALDLANDFAFLSALAVVRGVGSDLDCELARELDRAFGSDLKDVLDRALARDIARDLDSNADQNLVRDLARGRAVARALNSALARRSARHRVFARILGLVRDPVSIRDLAEELDSAVSGIRDSARSGVRELFHDLADTNDFGSVSHDEVAKDVARAVARTLHVEAFRPRGAAVQSTRSISGRATQKMLALAVRLLPAAQRPRYYEEFGVELAELSAQERWKYALRVLARAWELRRALAEAVHTSDGEPARRAEQ